MSDVWYYAEGQKTVGPVTLAELTAILSLVSRAKDVFVWRSGSAGWEKAKNIKELTIPLAWKTSSDPLLTSAVSPETATVQFPKVDVVSNLEAVRPNAGGSGARNAISPSTNIQSNEIDESNAGESASTYTPPPSALRKTTGAGKTTISIVAMLGIGIITAQFLTVFVVQPIGALPEGRTVIITRLNSMQFIDSADAWCERQMGSVNLLCRGATMARVINQATILARLPYSETLYKISTGGKTYDR